MLHRQIRSNPNAHYAVSINSEYTAILLQLGDDGDQVRLALTFEEADDIIAYLNLAKASLAEVQSRLNQNAVDVSTTKVV